MTDHTGAFHISLLDCDEPIVEGNPWSGDDEYAVRQCGTCDRCVRREGE